MRKGWRLRLACSCFAGAGHGRESLNPFVAWDGGRRRSRRLPFPVTGAAPAADRNWVRFARTHRALAAMRIRKGGIRETTEQFEAPPSTGNVPARWMLVGK